MQLLLAMGLDSNETIPAGSTIQVHIKGTKVILPVDHDYTVEQVLAYMNTLSPSLDAKHIVKLSNGEYAVVVE